MGIKEFFKEIIENIKKATNNKGEIRAIMMIEPSEPEIAMTVIDRKIGGSTLEIHIIPEKIEITLRKENFSIEASEYNYTKLKIKYEEEKKKGEIIYVDTLKREIIEVADYQKNPTFYKEVFLKLIKPICIVLYIALKKIREDKKLRIDFHKSMNGDLYLEWDTCRYYNMKFNDKIKKEVLNAINKLIEIEKKRKELKEGTLYILATLKRSFS